MSKSGDTDSEDKIGKSSFILFFYRVNENMIIPDSNGPLP